MITLAPTLIIFGAKYLFLVIIALAAAWFFTLQRARQKELAILAIITLPLAFILLKLAALIYYNPRPFVTGHFTPLIPHAADNGFPSDHTILSATIASLVFPYSRKLSWVLWILTALVALSRVLAGIHHPVDVLASMVLAILACVISFITLKHSLLGQTILKRIGLLQKQP